MSWKPIDTAPKDGSNFLGIDDEGVFQCRWDHPSWAKSGSWEALTLGCHGCGCCASSGPEPTHWMPLPEPPQ